MAIDAAQILARFPGPVTIYPSRKKWLLVFAISIAFTAGGTWMIASCDASGWFVLVFFGLGAIVAAAALLPGAGALMLDSDGFEVTNLFRHHRSHWQDTGGFLAARIPPARHLMVVYDDATQSAKNLAKINTAIVGRNAGLPDTYGLSADDLARLMAQWCERALGRSRSSTRP
jgi:hypothetical protein